ncbi:MAG: MFS transporter [Ilumatobacteraceae bacterium]
MILRLYRNFRLLWLGQVVSVVGDGMQRIALLWWAKNTGGNGLLSAVAACSMIPMIVCSPLGGWAADRFDRRRLLAGADLARMATTATLAVLLLSDHAPTAVVLLLVAITATGAAVFDPTYAATVPTLIPEVDRPAANGLGMANTAVGGLVGPLIGGGLIALFSVGSVMVVNSITFAWSAIWILMARLPKPAGARTADETSDIDADVGVGVGVNAAAATGPLRFLAANLTIRRLIGIASVLNLVVAPVPLLIVSLAVDHFALGASAYTVLAVMLSAGMLIGSLLAGRLSRWPMVVSLSAVGVCFAAVGVLPLLGVAIALVVCGVAISAANTKLVTTFQNEVPANVQGRAFGIMGSLSEGLRPLGLLLAAPLLSGIGVQGSLVIVGAAVVLTAFTWARPMRRCGIRRPAEFSADRSAGLSTSVARPAMQRLV